MVSYAGHEKCTHHSHQVDRPVVGHGRLGKVPSVHTELSVEESIGVGKVTDDRLGGSVVSSPMTSPSGLTTVLSGSAMYR